MFCSVCLFLIVEFMGYFFILSKDRDFILSRYSDNPFISTLSEQRATRYSDKPGIPTCRSSGLIFRNIGTTLSEHRYVETMICRSSGLYPHFPSPSIASQTPNCRTVTLAFLCTIFFIRVSTYRSTLSVLR